VEHTSTLTPAYWTPEHLDRVTIEGSDAQTYLHSQISQEIRQLPVGESVWTFLLAPTGKVEVFGRLLRSAESAFQFEVDGGFGQIALDRLNRFKIRVDVTTRLDTAPRIEIGEELEAARVCAGWPRMGSEIVVGETIPAETGLTAIAVNFSKGCYPGQELVERMDSRGAAAPRSLRLLSVDRATVVGDPIHDTDGIVVGIVTSVAPSCALGYVKRSSTIGEVVSIQL
jgi:tRNA-modifying protein YgfZ